MSRRRSPPVPYRPGPTFRRRRLGLRIRHEVLQPIPLPREPVGLRAPLDLPRLRRSVLGLGLILAVGVTLALGRFWWLSRVAPRWWEQAGLLPSDSSRRAEAVERGLTTILYRDRVGGALHTVELKASDANCWLTLRLPQWLANRGDRWPGGLSTPRVTFQEGRIAIGIEMQSEAGEGVRIVSMSFRPSLESDGSLRLVEADTRVGRAALGGLAGELASVFGTRSAMRGTPLEELVAAGGGIVLREILAGVRPAMEPALIDLDDGRAVRMLGLSLGEDRLRVRYATESTARAEAR